MSSVSPSLFSIVIAVTAFAVGSTVNPTGSGPARANLAVTAPKTETIALDGGPQREFLRADDGLFYIEARVNDVPVSFVVDTGATVVVLTQEDARRVGIGQESLGAADNMRTASGSTSMHWIRLEGLEIAGRKIASIDAAVTGSDMKVSLLGQNALSKLGLVTLRGDKLVIN